MRTFVLCLFRQIKEKIIAGEEINDNVVGYVQVSDDEYENIGRYIKFSEDEYANDADIEIDCSSKFLIIPLFVVFALLF